MEIYSIEDFDTYSKTIQENIRKAVIAVGLRLRDKTRNAFISDANSTYKYHIGDISKLAKGIILGKEHNCFVKLHAMGSKDFYDSYKTRFFVGGTKYRMQKKVNGESVVPFSKGRIKATESLTKTVNSDGSLLENYIKRAIDGNK